MYIGDIEVKSVKECQ